MKMKKLKIIMWMRKMKKKINTKRMKLKMR